MAHTLTAAESANITQAINLLEKGTAPELVYPSGLHEEIAQLVGDVARTSGFLTSGEFKAQIANAPILTLLNFIKFCGLSNTGFNLAINLLYKGQAQDTPLHAEVIQLIANSSAGFHTVGAFQIALQDRPISTLLRFLAYVAT